MPLPAVEYAQTEQSALLVPADDDSPSWSRALLACCQRSERWLLALAPFCAAAMLVSGITVIMILFPVKNP
jgi:hypothetical protein